MKIENIDLFKDWMEDNVYPCDWRNPSRWKNYLAITTMDDNGTEIKKFLPQSKDSDLYFNVAEVNVDDILIASCWDAYKSRQYKRYYIVIEKSSEELVLAYGDSDTLFTTYRKTFRGLQAIKNNRENNKTNDTRE